MIKLIEKKGNISLVDGGVPRSKIEELVADRKEELEAQYGAQIDSLNATIDNLQAENAGLELDVGDLTAQVTELSEDNAALNTTIDGLNTEIATLTEDVEFYKQAAPPDSAFVISGDCRYRFANGGWDWFIKQYGDKITTTNISNASYMFSIYSLSNIPFEINIMNDAYTTIDHMFVYSKIKTLPYINGKVLNLTHLFEECKYLNSIPEDWAEHINWDYVHSYQYNQLNSIFNGCYSLRNIPDSLIAEIWGINASNRIYVPYDSLFYYCYSLDEVNNIMPQKAKMSSNRFENMFSYCTRLKNATFALQDNGTPYNVSWKTQTIDLSTYVGYVPPNDTLYILTYNSGITADKEVTDDTTYQALKNDADWFTTNVAYSRYNHDSAVATINSLPDTSAYLASAGGTNTIKFKGAAGSATDGGAINTLTEEEIAVATAKGWTVTFV